MQNQLLGQKREELAKQLEEIDETLHQMGHLLEDYIEIIERKNAQVTAEKMPLFDGTEIVVFTVAYDNNFLMYFDGIIAEAKCHPSDQYDANIGYAICRQRLISKIMNIKYNI